MQVNARQGCSAAKKTNLDMQRKKASLWPWPMLKTRETVRPVERELRFMVDLARTGCETGLRTLKRWRAKKLETNWACGCTAVVAKCSRWLPRRDAQWSQGHLLLMQFF
jgi:hypothetical protein